ncbi:DUF1109 domain-containing protein [Pandoraea sp. ISTKB]|uniref:DUF1109 domain-containing protein n=1 Tax=Pandoraea sp. ISTKB TaxID=1586708 RepID=UPI000847BBE9|nr:DUF1109 domain-containing protein [Pandoraea sp. ISTKB]ODP34555.1 hypothetical protein A9762_14225 [Pandoraea sp. ISTKB]
MRTDEFVNLLAAGESPVPRGVAARRFSVAIAVALVGGAVLMLALYGIRPDIGLVARTPIFWAKVAFPLSLAVGAVVAVGRLARPAARVGMGLPLISAPVLVVWLAAAAVVATAVPEARLGLLLGQTWRSCPFNILLLSTPGFVAMIWAMRGLAPTRPRRAGAAAGLLASAIGTLVYCLHCPEMSPAFWGLWYLLGLLLPTLIGALLGPRLLRW